VRNPKKKILTRKRIRFYTPANQNQLIKARFYPVPIETLIIDLMKTPKNENIFLPSESYSNT
jgi:hypothetical protein